MAPFDECCVLLPSATLEDFPASATDSDACNILAAWTVLWHPELLAQTEQLPAWYRADAPPDSDGPRVVVVPKLSADQIPKGYQLKCEQNPDCRWIDEADRPTMAAALKLTQRPDLQIESRTIGVEDFYAVGFASLQIQVMTRRLRYTSNLDEIHLQNRIVAAAKAFIAGDGQEAIEAMHDVFDSLAEERDHYFSSDPHLLDITLLTPKTLETLVQNELSNLKQSAEDDGSLSVPVNILVDHQVAKSMINSESDTTTAIRKAIQERTVGWAGGDPDPAASLDILSFSGAEEAIEAGYQTATQAIGESPKVFGRFSGFTPSDLTPCLSRLGYEGMIPIDFSEGTGFGDEAKVIREYGGAEIHALTAKPMDASSDASFLDLGAKLGESIDGGEIATALVAHWPGQACQSFLDLKRVASWCLALGKFWRLDDYFVEGEHPYHHGSAGSVSPRSSDALVQAVEKQQSNPISSLANSTQKAVIAETNCRLQSMVTLITGKPDEDESENEKALSESFASVSGMTPSSSSKSALLLVNPNQIGVRDYAELNGFPPEKAEHVYATSTEGQISTASVDVPAYGFATVVSGTKAGKRESLWSRMTGATKRIADGTLLSNQFMEVSISPGSGGIQGVYSGATRGNRFSMRLVHVVDGDDEGNEMKADQVSVKQATQAVGEIQVVGKILNAQSKPISHFDLTYRLERGSRFLQVSGKVEPILKLTGDPWTNYVGLRVAVSSEAAILRAIVRDKVHRSRSRRIVSPLGLIVDESERQTLIASSGFAFHRRPSDRFVDTLVACQGETNHAVNISYGFDVPSPVSSSKAIAAGGATVVPIEGTGSIPPRGWILHAAPADTTINSLTVKRRADGLLAAKVRVIQTRAKSANASLRFFRDVQFATILTKDDENTWNQPIKSDDGESQSNDLMTVKDDCVKFNIASHQIVDLLVVFVEG